MATPRVGLRFVQRAALFAVPLLVLAGARAASVRTAPPPAAQVTVPPLVTPPGSILVVLDDPDDVRGEAGGAAALTSRLKAALAATGRPAADARPMWTTLLHGEAPINAGEIDRPAPSWWPPEMAADWATARAYCVAKGGQPPYGVTNVAAHLCGLQIAPILWQKWIDHLAVAQVVVAEVHKSNAMGTDRDAWNVDTFAYEPGSIDEHHQFRGELRGAVVADALAEMAVRATRGEGRIVRRTIDRLMPDSPEYHAHPVAAVPYDGVPVKGTVPPPSPLADVGGPSEPVDPQTPPAGPRGTRSAP